jgi:hypothetical protein
VTNLRRLETTMKVGQAQWQMRIEEETGKAEVEIGEAIEARPNGKGLRRKQVNKRHELAESAN